MLEEKIKGHGASTALRPEVRKREENQGLSEKVVGVESKLAEGLHYSGPTAINVLSDLTRTGPWTMMNPIYTEEELDCVQIVHRPTVTIGDKLAHGSVTLIRRIFDWVTGYKALPIPEETLQRNTIPIEELRAKGLLLSDKAWLMRIILLESFAGVPGMVAGTLRHLRSLRRLRRDGGWIHTLLEEAENERMHLLTFMTIAQPSWLTRVAVLGAQGVMYNLLFATYLITPKTAHRFVAALEEEAVKTYTHCVEDMQKGLVPEWDDVPAPQIAIDYWRLPQSAKLIDVIRAVRADEATHRFVNHSLADLDQKRDFNPFALGDASPEIRGTKAGFTREESAAFVKETQRKLLGESAQTPVEIPQRS
ncbi:hypothetical protein TREMEDRAFT_28860 [Tremella mesenterica DSM 1558]|uniref:uncharacterized protein n=1 Tax=Tremella mesenterica (strain ATCC 24925 / CBS 8224 / DSM 1558 / NBRC 9311 / NRRL Y-6157 / RJB 2259-6 / UBC 559-6) TaxID=578456 RepID=UPI0003F49970|nr:uncharacterized protein TREMEDRAFT_28860 [Tremella mesenterica DSM 1558]EIW70611.1 hypothetical protein TREMEDRAFT_28860 [Tremella mesenterica DSM 1558]